MDNIVEWQVERLRQIDYPEQSLRCREILQCIIEDHYYIIVVEKVRIASLISKALVFELTVI